jgi:ribonuclease BN (tRNA processing enzyme)
MSPVDHVRNAARPPRLTILGAGTCMLTPERACSGYWIEAGSVRMRLDSGAGTVHAMTRFGLPWETVTHQFISHFHLDHCGELPGLLWCLKHGRRTPRSTPLEILGPVGLKALLETTSAMHLGGLFDQEFPITVRELSPGDVVALDGIVMLSVAKTPHTPESLAVRVEVNGRSLAYTGDTAWSPDLPRFFGDVDVLVAECSYITLPRDSRHLDATQAAMLAHEAGARRLVPTHFYFDPEEERLAERLAAGYGGGITVAGDGVTIE